MENIDLSKIQEFTEKISKANQTIFQTLMDNQHHELFALKQMSEAYTDLGKKILNEPKEMEKVQSLYQNFMNDQQTLIKHFLEKQNNHSVIHEPVITPSPNDKRFKSPEWNEESSAYFDYVKQNYLLTSQLVQQIIQTVETEDKTKKKLKFYTNQFISALSPTNNPFTNPEVIKLAQETNGQSLIDGFNNFLKDMEKGRISQTDVSGFEVGRNLASTPGSVVFENDLIQLIQYTPTTPKVYEMPLLVISSVINKYYLMDMSQSNSIIKYLVDQGMTTFTISWKNPGAELKDATYDYYIEQGVFKAIEVIQDITKSKKVNIFANCFGATMVAVGMAILAVKKSKEENPINSATFTAALIDFSEIGPFGDILSHEFLDHLENSEEGKKGLFGSRGFEYLFNMFRPNELIWNYWVNNFLKGKDQTPMDLFYWTIDSTNVVVKMYAYYLRNIYLENKLARKNALRICNTPIDVGKIEVPIFNIAFKEDHIAPPQSAFTTTELVGGNIEFILGGAGHTMGLTNAPDKNKYDYMVNGELNHGYEHWKKTAQTKKGSWWTYWLEHLVKLSGKKIDAPKKAGNAKYKVIEAAPGRYLKEKVRKVSEVFSDPNQEK